ncbi:hypothetical protein RvY_01893 [Ramazzottius varieornatus]|uniref:C2H2-type domain-containing protein n=1 Tax=Ramazzottius varieornatus TaxID=947166 RepID=A0A1D1UHY1_RAMVA|nr:hypothetical protein RvY_01893 [Ramazzottius varieornatus]
MEDTLKGRLGESILQYSVAKLTEKFGLVKVLYCPYRSRWATATGHNTPCPFTCSDKARMDEHRKLVHGDDKPFLSGIDACLYRCKNSTRLRTHVLGVHPHAEYERDAVKRVFIGSATPEADASFEQNSAETGWQWHSVLR